MTHTKSLVPTPKPRLAAGPENSPDAVDHARRWLEHVEAGRIGTKEPMAPEILLQHFRNEMVLFPDCMRWGETVYHRVPPLREEGKGE